VVATLVIEVFDACPWDFGDAAEAGGARLARMRAATAPMLIRRATVRGPP